MFFIMDGLTVLHGVENNRVVSARCAQYLVMPPGLESPPGTPAPIRLEGLFTINGGVWGDMNIVGGQADYQFSFPMEVF